MSNEVKTKPILWPYGSPGRRTAVCEANHTYIYLVVLEKPDQCARCGTEQNSGWHCIENQLLYCERCVIMAQDAPEYIRVLEERIAYLKGQVWRQLVSSPQM